MKATGMNLVSVLLIASAIAASAATTLNSANHLAYGANIGWINWRGDNANGAVIGDYVCSGFIYSANVGWIHLGSGAPTNGVRYQNLAAGDFGVNHDGVGNLRGFAYGANIGWINFEDTGAPKVDLKTGKLSGFVYSANCGWSSLSNALAHVQTDAFDPGADLDGNGIADAWEIIHFGTNGVNANLDLDGDGMTVGQEYFADTNPLDPNSNLRITAHSLSFSGANDIHDLTWTSRPTRCYRVRFRDSLSLPWTTLSTLIEPEPGATTSALVNLSGPQPERYLRVEALRPLAP
jgi:hypothetical protein